MATKVQAVILGADVSKHWLDLNRHGQQRVEHIDNEPAAIEAFVRLYPGPVALAIEATNTYHELLLERALRAGWRVYLLSGYQLKHYAASIGQRMRNDPIDARLIARYLAREIDALKAYEPKPAQLELLLQLLKRRALISQCRQQLRQSLADVPALKAAHEQLSASFAKALADIDRRARQLLKPLNWQADLARLRTLPGIGPLSALALLIAYRSGTFVHRDPFIAYLGLDVRSKDSGYFRGQRKLTKCGEAEYRRLLHCAAMAAARSHPYFSQRYRTLTARGLPTTAAYVAIARQLARLAFCLLHRQTRFDPDRLRPPTPQQTCLAT